MVWVCWNACNTASLYLPTLFQALLEAIVAAFAHALQVLRIITQDRVAFVLDLMVDNACVLAAPHAIGGDLQVLLPYAPPAPIILEAQAHAPLSNRCSA